MTLATMPMHRFATHARRVLVTTPAILAACGALAATAHAAESLSITQTDATVTAGQSAHFQFAGTLDPNDTLFPFYLYVFVKDPAVDATCGADYDAETARAQRNGSANESALSGVDIGMSPTFSRSISTHYWKAGAFLICGYVNNDYFDESSQEVMDTVAKAQLQGTAVASGGGSGGGGGGSTGGETVTVAQTDATSTVGVATNLSASGTLDSDDTQFNFDLHAFAKDPAWDSTCGGSLEQEEGTLQTSHGNEVWLDSGIGWGLGKGPTFSFPFKVTPWKAGPLLICVYVTNDFSTVATANLTLNAQPASSSNNGNNNGGNTTPTTPTVKAPAVLKRPSIKRKGSTLTCRAGTWSGAPTSHRFRWHVKGKKRVVGKKGKLTLKKAWKGKSVLCTVSETNAAGTASATTRAYKVPKRGKR